MNRPPRLIPDMPLPVYAYVPGSALPHPTSDPRGHSYRKASESVVAPNPEAWQSCWPYLVGIDLFNYGYFWEAHEEWESLWRLCQRGSTIARFLQGLIKLAAAGVKIREGVPAGVRGHCERARELFTSVAADHQDPDAVYMGVRISDMVELANAIAVCCPTQEQLAFAIPIQYP